MSQRKTKQKSIAEQLKQILNHLEEVFTKFGYNINMYLSSIIPEEFKEIVAFAADAISVNDDEKDI
jgi:plasmid replication initiation protein